MKRLVFVMSSAFWIPNVKLRARDLREYEEKGRKTE
jgi:hypothetical protein